MNKVRFSRISAIITGWLGLSLALLISCLYSFVYFSISLPLSQTAIIFYFLIIWIIINYLILKFTIGKNYEEYGIVFSKNGKKIEPQGITLVALTWGLIWRMGILNIFSIKLAKVLLTNETSVIYVNSVLYLVTAFIAIFWLLKYQLGSILIIEQGKFNELPKIKNELASENKDLEINLKKEDSIQKMIELEKKYYYLARVLIIVGGLFIGLLIFGFFPATIEYYVGEVNVTNLSSDEMMNFMMTHQGGFEIVYSYDFKLFKLEKLSQFNNLLYTFFVILFPAFILDRKFSTRVKKI